MAEEPNPYAAPSSRVDDVVSPGPESARFVPGGRTILTVSSGLTGQPWRWFALWVVTATTIWASYAASLGFFFGQAFEDDHTLAFWLAFAAALGVTGLIELVRWLRHRGPKQESET